MKAFSAATVVLLLAGLLTACGGSSSSSPGASTTGTSTTGASTTGGTTGGGTTGGTTTGGSTTGGTSTGGGTTGSTTGGASTGGGTTGGTVPPDGALSIINPVDGFQTVDVPIEHSFINVGANRIRVAEGTTAVSRTIIVGNRLRRYVLMNRINPGANAPVLLLLHPSGTSPETMANLTIVTDYVLTQGFWAVMPDALGGIWQDDPGSPGNEDVPFISALIDTLIAEGGVDATRFYAAGFSSGGFMTERLACEMSDKIAAFGIDSATLRGTQAQVCFPARQRAKVYFLGSNDLIVPYNGVFGEFENGLRSAADTLDFWAQQQQCSGITTTALPNLAFDGTMVDRSVHNNCAAGTRLELYTINGGGHAWPGGESTIFGVTSRDVSATGLIWRFVSGYRR